MRTLKVTFLSLIVSMCTSRNEQINSQEKVKNEVRSLEDYTELITVKESNVEFKIPLSWKSVSFADTIPEYFAYKIFGEGDSAFVQISIDELTSEIDIYLRNEIDRMNSLELVDNKGYCIEEIKLKNKESVWYAQLDFKVSNVSKAGHFLIVPYYGKIYQFRLAMPKEWDNEWARYLMSQLAFSMIVDGVEIFKKSEQILEVKKDCS